MDRRNEMLEMNISRFTYYRRYPSDNFNSIIKIDISKQTHHVMIIKIK